MEKRKLHLCCGVKARDRRDTGQKCVVGGPSSFNPDILRSFHSGASAIGYPLTSY